MRFGIDRFLNDFGHPDMNIYIVAYGVPEAVKLLSQTMQLLPGQ